MNVSSLSKGIVITTFGSIPFLAFGQTKLLEQDSSKHYLKPEKAFLVDHVDVIEIDESLSITDVIESTLSNYPDLKWIESLEHEASAILDRSQSWFAGPAVAGFFFQEATSGTLHYGDASIELPLWNYGQQDAEEALAGSAQENVQSQAEALKLRVAGLVRVALWELSLQSIRMAQARIDLALTEHIEQKVNKMHDFGELPRADVLLARSETLKKKSALTLAEAEMMHTRKRYMNITRSIKIPAHYQENLSTISEIKDSHPALVALRDQIERKRSEISALEMTGSGQTNLTLGINSDRGNNDPRSNDTESFNIGIAIPFGGKVHLKPQIAAMNVELNKLLAEQELLNRNLDLAHHEAEHALEVNRAEMKTAENLKDIAEEHFKMMQVSFNAGEIDLMDLLKFQTRYQQAELSAKERSIMMQRDIALYNQAVGVLP